MSYASLGAKKAIRKAVEMMGGDPTPLSPEDFNTIAKGAEGSPITRQWLEDRVRWLEAQSAKMADVIVNEVNMNSDEELALRIVQHLEPYCPTTGLGDFELVKTVFGFDVVFKPAYIKEVKEANGFQANPQYYLRSIIDYINTQRNDIKKKCYVPSQQV